MERPLSGFKSNEGYRIPFIPKKTYTSPSGAGWMGTKDQGSNVDGNGISSEEITPTKKPQGTARP